MKKIIIIIMVLGLCLLGLGLFLNNTNNISNLNDDIKFNIELNKNLIYIKRTDSMFIIKKEHLQPKTTIDNDTTDFAKIFMYSFEHEKYYGGDSEVVPSISFNNGNGFNFYDHDKKIFKHEYYSCYDRYSLDQKNKIITIYKTENNEDYCKRVKNKDTIKILSYKLKKDKLELKIKLAGKEITYLANASKKVINIDLSGEYIVNTIHEDYKMTLKKDNTGIIKANNKTIYIKYKVIRQNSDDYIYFYDNNNTLNFTYDLMKIKKVVD